jgi:tRNA-splicing ligase RtcB (3'-phosphate/5'-hydroxy nucleic acid ligase)
MKLKLTGKQLRGIGYPEEPVISVAMQVMEKNYKHHSADEALAILKAILEEPASYAEDEILSAIAQHFLPKENSDAGQEISLNKSGVPFNVFGGEQIEPGAMNQMYQAAKLPVATAGALMPDAHSGYGLPIGGVLATDNAVIPYGVGVDIGCRMCLSIFPLDAKELKARDKMFQRELIAHTLFGSGREFSQSFDHPITEHEVFKMNDLLRGLQKRAAKQLGSSGSGNHFVEFGVVTINEADETLNVPPGNYVGLLSHSGSRGLGANIANHYTRVAMQKRKLAQEAKHLAWLLLSEEEGWEYWLAMNLAGDYASACHHVIHQKLSKAIGTKPLAMVENHHNFAWKEMVDGKEMIVHRKGATPAGKDVLGIIPGSMTAAGFIVKGKGEAASLQSASHGAGRKMSRTQATKNITHHALKEMLAKHDVTLIGGGLDEAPHAYKDIEAVMQSQQGLVDVVGKFYPKIVRMDG